MLHQASAGRLDTFLALPMLLCSSVPILFARNMFRDRLRPTTAHSLRSSVSASPTYSFPLSSPQSTILGNCWRALPLEEKRVWEIRAKKAKEEHAVMYPGYRFRPVHNKDKSKKKPKPAVTLEDEERCEAVAQLLLEGKKGDELAAAIRRLDQRPISTGMPAPHPIYPHRRSSSVPLPDSHGHPIALPSLPFLQMGSRTGSPVGNISRSARLLMGQRRPSSVQPIPCRAWGAISPVMFPHHDVSTLPDVDNTLFDPAFLDAGFSMRAPEADTSFVSHRLWSSCM